MNTWRRTGPTYARGRTPDPRDQPLPWDRLENGEKSAETRAARLDEGTDPEHQATAVRHGERGRENGELRRGPGTNQASRLAGEVGRPMNASFEPEEGAAGRCESQEPGRSRRSTEGVDPPAR